MDAAAGCREQIRRADTTTDNLAEHPFSASGISHSTAKTANMCALVALLSQTSKVHAPNTTLEQWRTLLTVVKHGGLGDAAAELGISHSAVSYALSRLQEGLGMKLVDIEGRQATLTPEGIVLLQHARVLLNEAHAVEELADNLRQGWEAEIRVAFDSAFPVQTLMEALRNFAPISRGARVQLREVGAASAEAALRAGSVDLIICERVPDGYLGEPLTTIVMVPVASPEHEMARAGHSISAPQLGKELQIEVRDAPRAQIGSMHSSQRWSVTGYDTATTLAKNGHGYAWLPRHRVQQDLDEKRLVTLKVEGAHAVQVPMHLVLAHPKQVGPATRKTRRDSACTCLQRTFNGCDQAASSSPEKVAGWFVQGRQLLC